MIEFGVSPRRGGRLAAKLHEHADAVARAYVDLFTKQIWEPFDSAGRPEEDWPKVREALEALRPLASDALLAMFQITMGEETEKAAETDPAERGQTGAAAAAARAQTPLAGAASVRGS